MLRIPEAQEPCTFGSWGVSRTRKTTPRTHQRMQTQTVSACSLTMYYMLCVLLYLLSCPVTKQLFNSVLVVLLKRWVPAAWGSERSPPSRSKSLGGNTCLTLYIYIYIYTQYIYIYIYIYIIYIYIYIHILSIHVSLSLSLYIYIYIYTRL